MADTPAATPVPAAQPAPVTVSTAATTTAPVPAAPTAPAPAPIVPTQKPMKIGTVPFLNAQPLLWTLKERGHQLFPVAPSEMGALLQEGRLDVALAPIAAYFLNPKLQIVPIGAIGCKGPVKSVRLLSHAPLQIVTKLYADARSQTSVLLARLVLKKWFGVKRLDVQHVEMADFKPGQTKPWEVTLQFGDNALITAPYGMTVTDLGEEWFNHTQKPFVFAVWMARNVPIAREIETDLLNAKNEGLKHFDDIANTYKGIWIFQRPQSKEYLEKNIHYAYGPEEVKGQLEFQKLLKEEGLII